MFISFSLFLIGVNECRSKQDWRSVDKQLAKKVFQLNVGLKMKLGNSLWIQVSDISSQGHYYVFTVNREDKGYQIIGRGSAFPFLLKNARIYFLTSNHVLDNARLIKEECEMFYAAAALYAERSASSNKKSFVDVLNIINLANKKDCDVREKELYRKTVNEIWDCYDIYLSKQADLGQSLFNKYKKMMPIQSSTKYFLHASGPNAQPAIEGKVYRQAKFNQPDLAVLESPISVLVKNYNLKDICLQIEHKEPFQGEEIQAVGYPVIADQNKSGKQRYYCPSFSTGKITRAEPHIFQFDALISKGNSGGPLVDQKGKVLGIVTTREVTKQGMVLPNSGGAVSIRELKSFVADLFSR